MQEIEEENKCDDRWRWFHRWNRLRRVSNWGKREDSEAEKECGENDEADATQEDGVTCRRER